MKIDTQKALPPQIERIEMKFTIPLSLVEPISEFASVYCSPDIYSLSTDDGYYRVNNLYFDSPEYLFVRMRLMSVHKRFNVRVRSYGVDSTMPYFLEIKQKIGQIIKKYRARITDKDWYKVYTEPGFESNDESDDPLETRNRKLFERMIFSYNASPKVFTRYVRKAFVSDIDDYARVTFDKHLMYRIEDEYNLQPNDGAMASCDYETSFDPDCSVILELKCYQSMVPLWMIDLIKYFDLRRRSFSKYLTGIREVLGQYLYSPTSTVANI
ncbi:MAG: polyphosphate polymerase domain-containing protein [Candidatus Electryoneaceae bacterium]|nr:polyphosphate polymerase domain-containing protein [Candidatus Electryoneaceae bacterium]